MDVLTPKNHAEAVALYRSQVIGPLLSRQLNHGELRSELELLCTQRFRSPGAHSTRRYSVATLQRWYYRFKHKGLSGLMPHPRKDRGRARELTAEQRELVLEIRREHPNASAALILRTLEADGRLQKGAVSVCTMRRLFQDNGLDRVALRSTTERGKVRLRWQAERPGALWHGDVCHGSSLVVDGKTKPVRIHALLDDASRYVVAIEAMHSECELDMLTLWVRAVRRWGPPDAVYLDNGATYRGHTLSLATARMGTALIHARPYDAQARGKMERFWRSLREGCLDFVGSLTSLHDLNVRLFSWVDEHYHKAAHGGLIGKTPAEVFCPLSRPCDDFDEQSLRKAMTIHARRRVRRDNTLAMDGTDWETGLGFLASRLVTVGRCLALPDEPPWIEHEGRCYPLHPVDPLANGSRVRSPNCLDTPHPSRLPFDPPKALLDKALGRYPTSKGVVR